MTIDEFATIVRPYTDGNKVLFTGNNITMSVQGIEIVIYTDPDDQSLLVRRCIIMASDFNDNIQILKYKYLRMKILGDRHGYGRIPDECQEKFLSEPSEVLSELCGTDMKTILEYLEWMSSVPYDEIRSDPIRYVEYGNYPVLGNVITMEYARSLV